MADLITRIYSNFRGVDFRGDEINLLRSPDALNVWKDYKETESIRTRPGMEFITQLGERVLGVFFYKEKMIVHTIEQTFGNLYEVTIYNWDSEEDERYIDVKLINEDVGVSPGRSFVLDDIWYFKNGHTYLAYDGTDFLDIDRYVPTTTIARKPMGGGTKHEDVNMMSDYRKNSFLADGASFTFFLDVTNIDKDYIPEVTVNDEVVSKGEYTVNYQEGSITFTTTPPDAPLTDGQDNVVIKFKKSIPEYRSCIAKCTLLQVFDNRVFFSGNPDHPNLVWHSSLNNPYYVSDQDWYKEGMDKAAVKGLVAGNNALWVFREPSDANTTVFYHTPALDDEFGKIYPSSHSSITTGCVGKAINFNDDIVFFSERGMEGISGDVTTEQAVAHRSSLVDRKMLSEPSYKDMILVEWEGYLLVFIGNKVYLADSRARFTNEDHLEYEWFMWELDHYVNCATVHNGILFLGTDDGGIYALTDLNADVESYWVTPLDKFKNPNKLKTTNKRGCVAEATGDVSVYAKLEDTDFELIGEHKDVKDYFVSRIKRKKFKDIQLKFHSKTRFSLETVTLEAFIGGYIKR